MDVRREGPAVSFEIIGEITQVETIASGTGIREIARLRRRYGRGRWRKRKGAAEVHLESGEIVRAEIHWYEATGIGKREFKIKRILQAPYAKSL
jgi:hypothetical protein